MDCRSFFRKSQPEKEEWTFRYQALMAHYGMQPTWNNVSIAHENGDVEQLELTVNKGECSIRCEDDGSTVLGDAVLSNVAK